MYLVTDANYETLANLLLEELKNGSYYSGVIEFSQIDNDGHDVEFRFVSSLIIYHTHYSSPEGDTQLISNIVPVWEECHTFVEMEEEINDFDIQRVKNYICTWS